MTREEAIKTLRELWRETCDPWYEETYGMAIKALKSGPKGEWKVRLPKPFFLCECSVCGESEEWMSKFCPNCGANMRGGDSE